MAKAFGRFVLVVALARLNIGLGLNLVEPDRHNGADETGVPTTVTSDNRHTCANDDVIMAMEVRNKANLERGMGIGAFIRSIRASGYDCSIVLGVSPTLAQSDLKWLHSHKVTPVAVPHVACDHDMGPTVCAAEDPLMPLALLRFMKYKQWLKSGNYTGNVLTTDTDVWFQRNPFEQLKWSKSESVIQVATEFGWDDPADADGNHGSKLGTNAFNRGWIANCMGSPAVRAIAGKNILCSGTVLGTSMGMTAYLNLMHVEIAKRAADRGCRNFGIDQGYHNFVVHTLSANSSLRVEMPAFGARDQLLFTIGNICSPPPSKKATAEPPDHSWPIERTREGYAALNNGDPAWVVHQGKVCFNQFYRNGWLMSKFPSSPSEYQ